MGFNVLELIGITVRLIIAAHARPSMRARIWVSQ